MSFIVRTAMLAVLLAPTAPVVLAQQVVPLAPRSAAPSAPVPSPAASAAANTASSARDTGLARGSAFDGYRGFTEQPVESWQKANDAVGRAGGWKAYAREGQGGAAAGSSEGAMPAGHAGHAGMSMAPSGASSTPAPVSPAASRPGPSSPVPVKVSPAATPAPQPGGHSGHKMP